MNEPKCVWEAGAILGEGPVWLEEENALYWLDILGHLVHRYVPAGGARTSWRVGPMVSCIAPRAAGGWVAGFENGVGTLDLDSGHVESLAEPEPGRSGNRFNDGKCDAAGRLWAGSMDLGESEPSGSLYRFATDGSWAREDEGYIITNGPAFSPDGTTLYHTDTLGKTIYAFDLAEDGSLSNKRPWLRIADGAGYPDGMTVDAEGAIWVAHFGGWRVTRFDATGDVDRVVHMPVAASTSCAFGGPDLRTLFITTAAKAVTPEDAAKQPLAGGLFQLEVDVPGILPNRFGA